MNFDRLAAICAVLLAVYVMYSSTTALRKSNESYKFIAWQLATANDALDQLTTECGIIITDLRILDHMCGDDSGRVILRAACSHDELEN